jgi:hypothetical protein
VGLEGFGREKPHRDLKVTSGRTDLDGVDAPLATADFQLEVGIAGMAWAVAVVIHGCHRPISSFVNFYCDDNLCIVNVPLLC